jgi:hypothetical protein
MKPTLVLFLPAEHFIREETHFMAAIRYLAACSLGGTAGSPGGFPASSASAPSFEAMSMA